MILEKSETMYIKQSVIVSLLTKPVFGESGLPLLLCV